MTVANANAIELTGSKAIFLRVYGTSLMTVLSSGNLSLPNRSFKTQGFAAVKNSRVRRGHLYGTHSPECSTTFLQLVATKITTTSTVSSLPLKRSELVETGASMSRNRASQFRIFAVYSTEWPLPMLAGSDFSN